MEKERQRANKKEAAAAAATETRRTRGGQAATAPLGQSSPTQSGGNKTKDATAQLGALLGSAGGMKVGERLRPPKLQEERKEGERLRLPVLAKERLELARERLRLPNQPFSQAKAQQAQGLAAPQNRKTANNTECLSDGHSCKDGRKTWPMWRLERKPCLGTSSAMASCCAANTRTT